MKYKVILEGLDEDFLKALHKCKGDWRAIYRIENDKIIIEAEDANALRAMVNYILRFLQAYEKINNLI